VDFLHSLSEPVEELGFLGIEEEVREGGMNLKERGG
jgi:hypothetical protein